MRTLLFCAWLALCAQPQADLILRNGVVRTFDARSTLDWVRVPSAT